ncbi:MAG TPA: hypothetical protein VLF59_02070 [Candidatus Saccharimonadales bacterium]|nr:hypothetical protein [Candidatus Saccharimonadales bacterium]
MKISTTRLTAFWRTNSATKLIAVGVGLIVVIAGSVLIFAKASGFFASAEPERGTLAGNAKVVADSGASGGQAVQFTAPSGGGGSGGCATTGSYVPDGPDPWGGCWPGPSSTGVSTGTTLTKPGVNSDGNYVVTTPNAVVSGIDLTGVSGEGGVLVQATGVTIKNSKVRFVDVDFAAPNADGGAHPTVIQDTEINCDQVHTGISTAVYYGNYTLQRVHVHDCENGLDMSAGHVQVYNSYWHHLYMCPDPACPEPGSPHTGVVQGDPGANSTMTHNWMEAINLSDCVPLTNYDDGHCNASGVIGWNNLGGGSNNVLIKQNMLKGGGSSIRCPSLASTNFVVTDNRVYAAYNSTGLSDDCAAYDAHDNRDAGTGAVVTLF